MMQGSEVRVMVGQPPWAPTEDSKLDETYRYYDVPLEGVFNQDGETYRFSCLDGASDRLSWWLIGPIDAAERARLDALTPGKEFNEAWRHSQMVAPLVLAIVLDEVGIVGFRYILDPTRGAFDAAFKELSDELEAAASEARESRAMERVYA